MVATRIRLKEICKYDKKTRIFETTIGDLLYVTSFENGIAVVEPEYASYIKPFAKLIAGCFHKDSNFKSELLKSFDCDENTAFTGIKFEFNHVTLLVTKENANDEAIYAEWEATGKANVENARLELEAYMKTPEYRAKRAKYLRSLIRSQRIGEEVLAIDELTEIEFKDNDAKAEWEKWVEINSNDSCSFACVKYARRWAKYMQHLMNKHCKSVFEIAENASQMSDLDGISGTMYSAVVAILSQIWIHGEDLQNWYNNKGEYEEVKGIVIPPYLIKKAAN